MITFLYALLAFGILIFFHELGHFMMAKIMGVRVLTFALGFGTKLLKLKWRGTEYAICAFPLGGYVKMMGEEPDEEISPQDRAQAFSAQPVVSRFVIVLAGPVFNLILALGIVWVLYWGELRYHTTHVQEVTEGYPAAQAGIKPGDRIVSVDGDRVHRWQEIVEKVMSCDGRPLRIEVERQGEIFRYTVHPVPHNVKSRYGDEIRIWRIGALSGEVATEKFGPGGAFLEACQWTWSKSLFTLRTLVRLVQGKESIKNIGSPLLIGMEAGKQAQMGPSSYFSFIAFISIILAIMNLLPIPVLDGGHLFFFALEGLARRPVSRRVRGLAQYVGLGILVCIMAWALYRDVDRFFYWKTKGQDSTIIEEPAESTRQPKQ